MNDRIKRKPVFSHRYEIAGNSTFRQICHWVRMKTAIMGNYDTGPGLKNLVSLWFIHYAAKPFYWLRTRMRNSHSLKQKVKRIVRKTD